MSKKDEGREDKKIQAVALLSPKEKDRAGKIFVFMHCI